MSILVTGSDGQLGTCFRDLCNDFDGERIYFANRDELDITNREAVENYIYTKQIELVLNFAAYTNVEKAETDSDNAFKVNALGPLYLAESLAKRNGFLLHISSDYVYQPFDGWDGSPFHEGDTKMSPRNIYGLTKRCGEIAIENSGCRYMIIRTSWLYSRYKKNFLTTVCKKLTDNIGTGLSLPFVCDQVGSPTNANNLAWFIFNMMERFNLISNDIVNFSDNGVCSWYDFACEIRRALILANPNQVYPYIIPCSSSEFKSNVKRPYYSVMSKELVNKHYLKSMSTAYVEGRNWRDCVEAEVLAYVESCNLK